MNIAILSDSHLGIRYFRKQQNGINAIEDLVYQQFEMCIEDIINSEPDLVLFAGDLFHKSDPSALSIKKALQGLTRLEESKIKTIILSGNHDYSDTNDKKSCHIFSNFPNFKYIDFIYDKPNEENIVTILKGDCSIICVPHFSPYLEKDNISIDKNKEKALWSSIIKKAKSSYLADTTKILLTHGIIESIIHRFINNVNDIDNYSKSTLIIPDIVADKFDYTIIGHIHNGVIQKVGNSTRISPGSIFPDSFVRNDIDIESNLVSKGPLYLDTETGYIESHDIASFEFKRINADSSNINEILANIEFNVYNIIYDGDWSSIDIELYNKAVKEAIVLNIQIVNNLENKSEYESIGSFWEWVQSNHPDEYLDFKNIVKEE